jgi:hypothetical protein
MAELVRRFNWIDREITEINTERFFLINVTCTNLDKCDGILDKLPVEYLEFTKRYGAVRFFRRHAIEYRLAIWWPPPRTYAIDKRQFVIVGRTERGYVAFEANECGASFRPEVCELPIGGGCIATSMDFATWLEREFMACKRTYGVRAWEAIKRGPDPLTEAEINVVEARKQFKWEVVETSNPPSLPTFRVENHSTRRLPFLSIRYHATVPALFIPRTHGGVFLPIDHIGPGASALITKPLTYHGRCDYLPPVLFEDPPSFGPQEREFLWEFRPMP